MQVRVPVTIKQKFGPQARMAFLKQPIEVLHGHLELSGELDLSGFSQPVSIIQYLIMSSGVSSATISLRAQDLEHLSKLPQVQYFDLAGALA